MKAKLAVFLPLGILLSVPSGTAAQACLGLPGEGGTVTFGFEGTDGAVGEGFEVSIRKGPGGPG